MLTERIATESIWMLVELLFFIQPAATIKDRYSYSRGVETKATIPRGVIWTTHTWGGGQNLPTPYNSVIPKPMDLKFGKVE